MTGAAVRLDDWLAAPAAPGAIGTPSELARAALAWIPAPVPGTAAQALHAAGRWSLDEFRDFDAEDWWYRCTFRRPPADAPRRHRLHVGGLATLAEVWLNGRSILRSDNMFQEHRVDVTPILAEENQIVICCRSLAAALTERRPRPRWKTRLVSHQQLRWFRTTLLGRIPGWSPPVAPVGPWRGVSLERLDPGVPRDLEVRADLDQDAGVVELTGWIADEGSTPVAGEFQVGGRSTDLQTEKFADGYRCHGRVRIEDVERWWPHTHGRPALYPCTAEMMVDGSAVRTDCGAVGFRRIEARTDDGGFALLVNGTPVFCRGACWTPSDILSLNGSPAALAHDLARLRQAGANMVRVGGTMVYESDAFYRLCDELGLLVWQDFMFANMDYPDEDGFRRSVELEVTQQLARLRRHPSVAVYCGNSEVEQQAAMLGVPRTLWRSDLFARDIPALCARLHPDVPFVPSTPSGGALPFHTGTGLTHYYGVGAYRRPLTDVRRAHVRFTPECLGFANVPEPDLVDRIMGGAPAATHDPRWKRGTPRDTGAGWDFEDVRDHYLAKLFGIDPVRLRSSDIGRYLDLSRIVTGEVMTQVFAEWRGRGECQGGLVWFWKDLWPGAGWGMLDSRGVPKACFYALKRAWQPQAVLLTDEGLDGLQVHAVNDTARACSGSLALTLLQDGHVVVAEGRQPCEMAPRARTTVGSDAILDGFLDVAYAYRFGPPKHDVVAARLFGEAGETIGEAFWFPDPAAAARPRPAAVVAEAQALDDASYALSVTSDRFLFATRVDARGYVADDNYFHLMPGQTKVIRLQPLAGTRDAPAGDVAALNLDRAVAIEVTTRRLVRS